jgi:anti-anti-sigma factor
MDSSGFGALVGCLKKVREAGSRLALRSPASQMKLVLEITGTDKVFEYI